MPVVPMREILDRAFAERYGVAAINVVDDLTLEAVLAAATDLEAPLIVQTSLKTVKAIGAAGLLHDVARAGRRGARPGDPAPRPLPGSRSGSPPACARAGTRCSSTARSSTSRRTRARPSRWWPRPTATAPRSRGRSRASSGVEDGIGSEEGGEIHPVEVSSDVHRRDRRLLVRPGDRHGPRPLQGRAEADARARERARRAAPDPDGAARRHRADGGAVHRPHRPRVRQGQHLHGAQDRLHRRAPRVPGRQPRQARSALALRSTSARPSRRWPSTTSASSGRLGAHRRRPPRPYSSVPALIFDCDGVLADTERDGHRPAFNQTFAEAGLPVQWSEEEYAEKLRIGGGKERMASLLTAEFVREHGLPGDPRARGSCWPSGTVARPRSTRRWCAPGACPAAPASPASSTRRSRPAGRWPSRSTSAEESVRAVLEHVVGDRRGARASRSSPATSSGQEARSGDLPAGARAHGRRAPTTRSSSRTRATACWRPWARACAAS